MTVKLPDDKFSRLTPSLPRFISVAEAAEIAGVTPKCIRDWVRKIEGLGFKRVGRVVICENNLLFLMHRGIERYRERYAEDQAKRSRQQNHPHQPH